VDLPFEPIISVLNKRHNRSAFSCGKISLDHYLQRQASQDIKRGLSVVFILETKNNTEIAAYYALSSLSIDAGDLTKSASKKLPTKRPIPCTLLGQFAVDQKWKNQGIGGWLLVHVLYEVLIHAEKVGSFALIVDAVDDDAHSYWQHCGFIEFPNMPKRLFLPINTIKKWLAN